MSERRARLALLVTAALFVPLPYMIVGDGYVPLVRFAMLGAISTSYSLMIDGSGVAWIISAILVAHFLMFAALLTTGVSWLGRRIPAPWRRSVVVGTFAIALLVATWFPTYRTPFSASAAYGNWTALFR